MCASVISFARIRRVYYGAPDPKSGGVEHGPRIFSHATCHHRPELYPGLGESEAGAILKAFFAARRPD
jgi:tRNA(Arg) A34 adenosine deaminase TadA